MTLAFDSIESQREAAGPFVIAMIWIMVPVIATFRFVSDNGDVTGGLAAATTCAILATVAWRIMGRNGLGRALSGVFLMAQVSIGVAGGGDWQIDWHMAYFAALALLIVYCDPIAILAATATVAVHHLVLSYLVPSAVFSGAASLDRVAFHAAILLVEAGTLAWVTTSLGHMFEASARSVAAAEKAVMEAQDATVAADRARKAEKLAQDHAGLAGAEGRGEERAMILESIGAAVSCLMQGILTHRIVEDLPGEYGQLRNEFNDAVIQLQNTVALLVTSSETIRSGIDSMSSSNQELAKRTQLQAENLERTAAAVHEITSTVRKTADDANHARQIVDHAKQDAEQSGQVMRDAVKAMTGIEKSSAQIGQIIGVIDEIAFQTNLLALNAGIEAARAGDSGRGFAVVASEVRALAQRSADAAKEIKGLVTSSGRHVAEGVDLVSRTEKVVERILGQVVEITGVVTEIAASAQNQATSLDQVNGAVAQMDQVTQQNAAMVEESTTSSQVLAEDIGELYRLISRFDVGRQAAPGGQSRAKNDPVRTKQHPPRAMVLKVTGPGGAMRNPLPRSDEDWLEF